MRDPLVELAREGALAELRPLGEVLIRELARERARGRKDQVLEYCSYHFGLEGLGGATVGGVTGRVLPRLGLSMWWFGSFGERVGSYGEGGYGLRMVPVGGGMWCWVRGVRAGKEVIVKGRS